MQRRRVLGGTAGLAAALLAGCTGGGSDGAEVVETSEVSMVGSQFDPRNVHVDAGAAVTWTNDDDTSHTVTNASDNWSFDEEVGGGGSTSFTFDESGVYDVYCRLHGSSDLTGMSMKIGVGDAAIQEPLGSSQQGGGVY